MGRKQLGKKLKEWFAKPSKFLNLTWIFAIFAIVLLTLYIAAWSEIHVNGAILIKKITLTFWATLGTIFGLLIAIHRQFKLENSLDIHNKAIVMSNIKTCAGLIDDILILINDRSTSYKAVNMLRERIELHLNYCQKCCNNGQKELYLEKSHALSRFESELRKKIRSPKMKFDDDSFVEEMKALKNFLIKEDQTTFKL